MLNGNGDLWRLLGEVDALCITTNGFIKRNGSAVMGRGCARQAMYKYPGLDAILGEKVQQFGNEPLCLINDKGTEIWSFPVKPRFEVFKSDDQVVRHMRGKFGSGSSIPGWACVAQMGIILESANAIKKMADLCGWRKVALPRPGCGAGELNWEEVGPALSEVLDDRFIAITY